MSAALPAGGALSLVIDNDRRDLCEADRRVWLEGKAAFEALVREHERRVQSGGDESLPVRLDPDAARVLDWEIARAEAENRPASQARILKWLTEIAAGIPRAPEEERMTWACRAVFEDCAEIPAAAWTRASVLRARTTFKWWPGSAELHAFLTEEARPIRRRLMTLRALRRRADGAAASAPPREGEPDARALAHVRSVVAAYAAECRQRQPPPPPPPRRAYASPAELIARYEEALRGADPGARLLAELALRRLRAAPDEAGPEDADR